VMPVISRTCPTPPPWPSAAAEASCCPDLYHAVPRLLLHDGALLTSYNPHRISYRLLHAHSPPFRPRVHKRLFADL